ncbi:hypothetical protein Tco_0500161 [Tanacetum coccineum]
MEMMMQKRIWEKPSELGLVVMQNSKKMQKAVFKQHLKLLKIPIQMSIKRDIDRFQQLLSQLEAHGAEVSTEDANHKFLRSLPPAWSNLAMTMRTNPEIDNLSIDDLYNNLRVFEQEIQGFADESNISLLQTLEDWNYFHEDLAQIDDVDIEEMEYKLQIAMISIDVMKKVLNASISQTLVTVARPCTANGTQDGKKKSDSFYQHQEAGKQEKNHKGLLTMEGWDCPLGRTYCSCKVGIGFEIQSNNEVLSYEEEMNFFVFKYSKEDSIGKPSYSRFTKTNDFKGSLKKPKISVLDDNSSEHSTYQSNDSEGSCGNTSEHSFETKSESLSVPNELSKSRLEVTNEKVVSELQEVEPSCAKHVKTPRQPLKDKETQKVNRKNWNDMMERELGEVEAEVNRPNINTGRTNINSVRPKVNAVSPKVNTVRSRQASNLNKPQRVSSPKKTTDDK